jgi:lipopolysaccharide assembly protein A
MANIQGVSASVMRIVAWVLRIALFLLVLGFALRNSEVVTVRFYLGYEWQASLVLVILLAFAAGAVFGVLALLPALFRQRRRISRLHREAGRGRISAPQPPSDEVAS